MINGKDDLNDDLSDLLGAAATGPAAKPIYRAPDRFVPAVERVFTEACSKCGGTGRFRSFGQCFACKGQGKFTFKTSSEQRAKARAGAADRKVRKAAEYAEEFKVEIAWVQDTAAREETKMGIPPHKFWEFPMKLAEAFAKYGSFTDGQLAAIRKCMARDAERAEQRKVERAAREAAAPVADTAGIDRLKAAFDKAIEYAADKGLTMRTPKITIGDITISPAKATSANPGALYAKAGETYLGKIAGGRFLASRECTSEQGAQILAFVADPKQAAEAYGQTTGVCCVCNATLRSEWKLRGIGPICASKMGW